MVKHVVEVVCYIISIPLMAFQSFELLQSLAEFLSEYNKYK